MPIAASFLHTIVRTERLTTETDDCRLTTETDD